MKNPTNYQLDFASQDRHWDSNSSIYSNITLDELLKLTNQCSAQLNQDTLRKRAEPLLTVSCVRQAAVCLRKSRRIQMKICLVKSGLFTAISSSP